MGVVERGGDAHLALADPPFAPWGGDTPELVDDRPWEVRQFTDLYRALGAKNRADIDGIDDLYIYELAGLLGVGRPEPPDTSPAGVDPGRARAIERIRAAQAGAPPPEAQAPDAGVIDLLRMGMG